MEPSILSAILMTSANTVMSGWSPSHEPKVVDDEEIFHLSRPYNGVRIATFITLHVLPADRGKVDLKMSGRQSLFTEDDGIAHLSYSVSAEAVEKLDYESFRKAIRSIYNRLSEQRQKQIEIAKSVDGI